MLPVCVMVPPPSPTFYCALFIYFVVFFLSWLLFSCSHRAIIVCVCVWLTLKMCWVFCLVRAPVHSLKLLTLLRKADISGARSIVWCRVKKSMCRKKALALARSFSLKTVTFIHQLAFHYTRLVFFALSHRCCYYFYFNFGALFVGWYFLLFVVIENVYCEFYDFWNAANNNRIRFYVGRPMLVHSRWNCSWELTFFLSVVNVVAGVVSIVVIIIINNVQPSICECAIWLLLF